MRKCGKKLAGIALCLAFLTGCGTGQAATGPRTDKEETITEQNTEETTQETTQETASKEEPEETESQSKPDGTTLTYIGHAAVKIVAKDGSVLYVDPYYSEGDYSDKADVLLITHGHSDHQPAASFQAKDTCEKITYKEALVNGEYKSFESGPFSIQAVAAGGNSNHNINVCVGYLITVDGITIYHAGDTSMIDQMKELSDKKIDYAMYPIDGEYNMDAAEATEVANLVGAKHNIPIHEFNGTNERKQDNFLPEGRLELQYGETIELSDE